MNNSPPSHPGPTRNQVLWNSQPIKTSGLRLSPGHHLTAAPRWLLSGRHLDGLHLGNTPFHTQCPRVGPRTDRSPRPCSLPPPALASPLHGARRRGRLREPTGGTLPPSRSRAVAGREVPSCRDAALLPPTRLASGVQIPGTRGSDFNANSGPPLPTGLATGCRGRGSESQGGGGGGRGARGSQGSADPRRRRTRPGGSARERRGSRREGLPSRRPRAADSPLLQSAGRQPAPGAARRGRGSGLNPAAVGGCRSSQPGPEKPTRRSAEPGSGRRKGRGLARAGRGRGRERLWTRPGGREGTGRPAAGWMGPWGRRLVRGRGGDPLTKLPPWAEVRKAGPPAEVRGKFSSPRRPPLGDRPPSSSPSCAALRCEAGTVTFP